MNQENLEFLVYDLSRTDHDIWTGPHNIFGIFQVNYPEVTLDMVKSACESLFKRGLLDRWEVPQEGPFYRRRRIWGALDLPKRDKYGNLGEDDDDHHSTG
jgi:hypothetical protein